MERSISYKQGFIPYALAALLIGLVGGFSTVLGPSFVQDIGIAYNNTTKPCPQLPAFQFLGRLAILSGAERLFY